MGGLLGKLSDFDPSNDKIWLYVKDRSTADFLRTLAHELVHRKQAEDGRLKPGDGATGSDIEDEANAEAGVLLRKFGKDHEEIYDTLNEITVNNPGNFKFEIGDKVADKDSTIGKIIGRTSNIKDEYSDYTHPEGAPEYESPFSAIDVNVSVDPHYLIQYGWQVLLMNSIYWRPENELFKI